MINDTAWNYSFENVNGIWYKTTAVGDDCMQQPEVSHLSSLFYLWPSVLEYIKVSGVHMFAKCVHEWMFQNTKIWQWLFHYNIITGRLYEDKWYFGADWMALCHFKKLICLLKLLWTFWLLYYSQIHSNLQKLLPATKTVL